VFAFAAVHFVDISVTSTAAIGWGLFAALSGLAFALAMILVPAACDARNLTSR